MKAYVTSVGEPTTELCVWSLERQGFEVELITGDTTLAEKLCKQLLEVGAYIKDYRQSKFGQAYMLLALHPSYDHKRFLSRAEKYQSQYIVRYENLSDYIRSIEALYNFNTKAKNQIMLKIN